MLRTLTLAAALAVLALAGSARAGDLQPGSKAPPFSLSGSDGRTHSLAEYAGRKGVVLAWFPKAFSPGCTQELKALRDSAKALSAYDVAVFMVSLDEPEQNRAFAKELGTQQVLLSDPLREAAEAYGVVGPDESHAKRWTFYIDATGTIRRIDKNVHVASAGQDIARTLEQLGFPKAK